MKKLGTYVSATFAGAMLFLTACGNAAGDAAQPAPGNNQPANVAQPGEGQAGAVEQTATYSTQSQVDMLVGALANNLDPHISNDSSSAQINGNIYSTLLYMNYNDFSPVERLATSWEMIDGQTIDMTLRSGVTFHNGMPLTAYDVQFSLERASNENAMQPIIGMLSHVDVHDNYNFTIHLDMPYAPILRHLAHVGTSIISRELYESGHDLSEHPIGTGPFMFVENVIGSSTTLERNPNYFGGAPLIETVVFRAVTEASVRLIEVEAGTADIGIAIQPADIPVAEASANVELMRRTSLQTNYIGMNVSMPPLDDVRVRQAIRYALNTEQIFHAVMLGIGTHATNVIPPHVFGYSPVRQFDTNLDRARELLAEAGLADGFTIPMWYNVETIQRRDIAELTANLLRDLNIDIEIVGLDWPVYLQGTEAGEQGLFVLGWSSLGGDADYGLWPNFHGSLAGTGGRTFLQNDELDALLDAGRAETDPATRQAIYAEALYLINELSVWIPINFGQENVATNPNMRGFVMNPGGLHNLANVYFVN